jgi:hypothetical protein
MRANIGTLLQIIHKKTLIKPQKITKNPYYYRRLGNRVLLQVEQKENDAN